MERLIAEKFGPGAAATLAPVLGSPSAPDRMPVLGDTVLDCETPEEVATRMADGRRVGAGRVVVSVACKPTEGVVEVRGGYAGGVQADCRPTQEGTLTSARASRCVGWASESARKACATNAGHSAAVAPRWRLP